MQDLVSLSSSSSLTFPTPTGGASLLLAFRAQTQTQSILIIGSGILAASRAFAALEADFEAVVLAKGGLDAACAEIQWRVDRKECTFVDWDQVPSGEDDGSKLDAFLSSTPTTFSLACITDTTIGSQRRTFKSAENLYHILKSHRISANTSDIPELCDFTFTSTHRLDDTHTSERSPLQIGVTTNGQGCRLAGRIRRDIVAKLPKDVGRAASNLGKLRQMAKEAAETLEKDADIASDEINEDSGLLTPNRPVPVRGTSETALESIRRRLKWVSQVSEYWPISKIADMADQDMAEVLLGENLVSEIQEGSSSGASDSRHALSIPKRGRILLVGSGPGHPSLLTIATHNALTKLADLVLSDKLVPDAVLALIPKTVQIRIARKFPGNADGAQQEMQEAAVEAAKKGLTVVRLKQGDPVVYGRAGEEVLYFRKHGFEPLVIPGVSSALAAPTFAGIPVTQRGVAESFTVCTGVGRKGKEVQLPGYERSRTLVVLMGVARLPQVVEALTSATSDDKYGVGSRREGAAYPGNTPIAIIERASMPDQRVLTSTLENVVEALDSCGEQRPPGMMVIGWSVLALWGKGDVEVLEGEQKEVVKRDAERVKKWLDDRAWRVQEGIDEAWNDLQ
ncbi:hypothetical protein D9756_006264 [Leucocoprinus leucothites]|uniref:precorrin-2 dehydrogenase n=1 Tax=Leucocoprinus leucothites TaxID=201217 RepID=A0A8H5D4M4_9AGAR|nr:hypothetical protein D9756_006264 [Leucoagaricus leucothites]